jgi:hypothetical protein
MIGFSQVYNCRHFENYLYTQGTRVSGEALEPGVGIEINYGAFADTQVTWAVPLNPNPGPGGMGLVWAPLGGGVKYRFIQEDDHGWRPQVAIFPQVFIPVTLLHGSAGLRAWAG